MQFSPLTISPAVQDLLLTSPASPTAVIAVVAAASGLSGYFIGKISQVVVGFFVCAVSCLTCCLCMPCAAVLHPVASIGLCAAITFIALPQLATVSLFVQTTFFIGTLIAHIPSKKSEVEQAQLTPN